MLTITLVKRFTKTFLAGLMLASFAAQGEWKVDFSRRQQVTRQQDLRGPASVSEFPQTVDAPPPVPNVPNTPYAEQQQSNSPGFFQSLFESREVSQEIVLLNTDKGFVPANIRVKRGHSYKINVVNVNDQEKNVSFVLDSFSEHHATYYGKIKTFVIKPQKEGVYRFVSPETGAQGKLVVYPDGPETRLPASE